MTVSSRRMRVRFSASTAAIVLPLFICVALNALVRPWLAGRLGGALVQSGGNSVRGGPNRWWTFDASTHAEHPGLTGFLTISDGALGMITFAVIGFLLIGGWVVGRIFAWKLRRGHACPQDPCL